MAQYQYDEAGGVFTVFLLTILAITLVPASFYALSPAVTDTIKFSSCKCDACSKKRSLAAAKPLSGSSRSYYLRLFFVVLGWLLLAFIAYKAAHARFAEVEVWDPYQILGVDSTADDAKIKSSFRKLSLKLHPDKVAPSEKEAAEKKFVEVSKAYKVLTDAEARNVFDETGHPDGKQALELGVALPKWLIEQGNTNYVLLVYTLAFGVGLPIAVARWWSGAKHFSKNRILNNTMAIYYRELKDGMPFRALVEVLSKSVEFQSVVSHDHLDEYDKLADKVKEEMEAKTVDRFEKNKKQLGSSKDPATLIGFRAWLLITAHLLRIRPEHPVLADDQIKVIQNSTHLISGMLQIASSRNWLKLCVSIIELSQSIVQALYYRQSPLQQLPVLDLETLKYFHTKKRNINTIEQFVNLKEEERRSILRGLDDEQYKSVVDVAALYPAVKIVKAQYDVLGEPVIGPKSIVTLSVKLRTIYNGVKEGPLDDEFDDPEEEGKKSKWWDRKSQSILEPHAPYFPALKKPTWWIMLANAKEGHMICMNKVVDLEEDKTVRLQFQSPPQSGSWTFQLIVKSDTFVGTDVMKDLRLTVADPSEVPSDDEEDDISEPDEDTIAGQMKALRGEQSEGGGGSGSGGASGKKTGSPTRPKVHPLERMDYDDSTDSEDDYDEKTDPGKPPVDSDADEDENGHDSDDSHEFIE